MYGGAVVTGLPSVVSGGGAHERRHRHHRWRSAGLTAAIYAARARRPPSFEHKVTGGQIVTTDAVENFPASPTASTASTPRSLVQQAEKPGAQRHRPRREPDGAFTLETGSDTYRARAVIVTAGADYNRLGVPGETEFTGRGVSWCATCDAAFFKDQEVAVVGGGDAALDEGLFVTRYARKVHLIHRRDELRASRILQERAFGSPSPDTVVER
jgi:thioredoxin reductase (NADPH)